mgnify:CR=1 FL=1
MPVLLKYIFKCHRYPCSFRFHCFEFKKGLKQFNLNIFYTNLKMVEEEPQVKYFEAKYLDPKFPIIKPDPTVDDVIKGLRTSDYLFVSGVMAGTYAYGFLLGKPVRGPTAVMCASAGFTFGMFHTMQTVRSRFLGYRENDREVKKFGLAPLQPIRSKIKDDERFPIRKAMITKEALNWDKY